MSDTALTVLGAGFVAAVLWDLYVVVRFTRAAVRRPHIEILTALTILLDTIAVATALGMILGVNGAFLIATGARLVDQDAALLILGVALALPSIGTLPLLRLLRRWDGERNGQAYRHRRDSEAQARPHRRADDPPA